MGRVRCVFLSGVAATVLYCNVAILANEGCTRLELGCHLPVGFLLGGLLNIFPVFKSYDRVNTEVEILGLPYSAGDDVDVAAWIRLDVNEYFPYRRGEQHARILAIAQRYLGSTAQQESWSFFARKVRARFNRLNPNHPIKRVRFRQLQWPRSRLGYTASKTPALLVSSDLYTEP